VGGSPPPQNNKLVGQSIIKENLRILREKEKFNLGELHNGLRKRKKSRGSSSNFLQLGKSGVRGGELGLSL